MQSAAHKSPSTESRSPRTELRIQGMTCSGCARAVAAALERVSGVRSAEVNLSQGLARATWADVLSADDAKLIEAVKRAGYSAALAAPSDRPEVRKAWSPFRGWRLNVILGTIVTVPLMIAEWIFGLGMERGYQWVAFVLVTPVQLVCGARFYRGAWNQLKVGSSNMDTLVALGSTTAFAYSAWGLLSGVHGHLFFMESASIITLISAGHWIESMVSAKAESSLKALLCLAPQTARLLSEAGAESEIPVAQLQIGDKVLIKPGDRIPIDGEILEGASSVDESMLTGESLPVEKGRGAKVYAGTLNASGLLQAHVTATGETTALAHIIEVVRRAQSSRANIQKLGDRVSSIFVPIVIVVALGTAVWWGLASESALAVSHGLEPFLWLGHHPEAALASAIYHAAAVLIIACPCAMGLATPVAIMAGANVASERGILIRDGLALEKAGQLNAILFDKTGTLTQGKITVVAVKEFTHDSPELPNAKQIAASLAAPSQHPLSAAVAKLSDAIIPVGIWQERRGAGVEGTLKAPASVIAESTWRLGSLRWLDDVGVEILPAAEFAQVWSAQGATLLGLARNNCLAAAFALVDEIKPNAEEIIAELKRQGMTVGLITGDNKLTAGVIAESVGIESENVFAEIRPEEKASIVREFQERGQRLAFVGDGINDAPALEQADLGIAVSRASDVAKEAADIILLRSDLRAIPEALHLARATLRTIKQNLFWAFFYNAAAVPLAVFGFVSPVVSALAMGMSDLMVILNALRLRRWRHHENDAPSPQGNGRREGILSL
ncbi:MAG: cation-translocating P-type ATPase [Verrucomicrobia bacterium]|nr:cation-translocating P-type ATPase [Verrucomicrobiota bacterium]